jgi:hypothetical protein
MDKKLKYTLALERALRNMQSSVATMQQEILTMQGDLCDVTIERDAWKKRATELQAS